MELEEVLHRKYYREQLELSGPSQPQSPVSCADMSDSEKISFIQFLESESHKKDDQIHRPQQTIDAQSERLSTMQDTLDCIQRIARDENVWLHAQLAMQGDNLKKLQANSKALSRPVREAAKYRGLYKVLRDEKFSGTSQKSVRPESGRDEDDWDGTGFKPKDAYKLCDLKPFYGVIHESDIKQYDWWIFGDMDLVHGDLSIIVNDENLKKYDSITTHCYYVAGHFTIIRKSSKYTRCCLCIPQWQSLLLNNEHQGVDEGVWCHVVYPQLSKVRSFYEHIGKKIFNQDLWEYLAWTNRVFCNRLTKRVYIEYYTTPAP